MPVMIEKYWPMEKRTSLFALNEASRLDTAMSQAVRLANSSDYGPTKSAVVEVSIELLLRERDIQIAIFLANWPMKELLSVIASR